MKKIFLILITTYCLLITGYAQTDNHVFVERGETTVLTWKAAGDYSSYDSLYFAVKACTTSLSCGRLISPSKSVAVTYSAPYSTLVCTLYAANTGGLNAAKYYYSIYAYGSDTVNVTSGNFNLMLNGQTPTDGVASTTPIYTLGMPVPTSAASYVLGKSADSTLVWISEDSIRTRLGIDTLTLAGTLPDSVIYTSELDTLFTKTSHIVNVKEFGAVGDSTTDDTDGIQNALNYIFNNGGGELYIPEGYYNIDGLLTIPRESTADGDNPYKGRPIKITGAGAYAGNRSSANIPIGGSVLIMNYDGDEGYKIFTEGNNILEVSGVTFYSPGVDSNATILTTNTVLWIHNCTFWGARTGTDANQDAIILGGLYTGNPARGDSSGFQGYGTVIKDNYFNRIRRAVYGRTFANGVIVQNNTIWNACGSNLSDGAAIEFWGNDADPVPNSVAGGVISGNLIEIGNYPYGIKLFYALGFSIIANNFYDQTATTQAYYYLDTSAVYNYIQRGYHGDDIPMFVEIETGSNTIVDFGASQYSYYSQRLSLGNVVRFTNTNSMYWVNPSDMTQNFNSNLTFSSQPTWEINYVDTTGASTESMLKLTRVTSTNHQLRIGGSDVTIGNSDASSVLRLQQGSGGSLWLGVDNNLYVSGGRIFSNLTTGTSPLAIISTTPVDNLTVKRIYDPSFLGDTQTGLDMNSNSISAVSGINAPGLPADTSGAEPGDLYYNLTTGKVSIAIGENLVENGTFDNWDTQYKPTDWAVTITDGVNKYVEEDPSGQCHFVYTATDDTLLIMYQSGIDSGVVYGYSFDIKSISGLVDIGIGGASFIPTLGLNTGEITSTINTTLFAISSYTDTSTCDLVIDNIRVWKKTGGNLQATIDGADWSVFYTDSNGIKQDLGIGASGTVLKSTGTTSAPSWQSDATGAGGSAYTDSVVILGRHVPADSLLTIDNIADAYQLIDSDLDNPDLALSLIQDSLDTKLNRSEYSASEGITTGEASTLIGDSLAANSWGWLDGSDTLSLDSRINAIGDSNFVLTSEMSGYYDGIYQPDDSDLDNPDLALNLLQDSLDVKLNRSEYVAGSGIDTTIFNDLITTWADTVASDTSIFTMDEIDAAVTDVDDMLKLYSIVKVDPDSNTTFTLMRVKAEIVIDSVFALVQGASGVVDFNLAYGTNRTSGTNVFGSSQSADNVTVGETFSTFSSATIPINNIFWLNITNTDNTPTEFLCVIYYH